MSCSFETSISEPSGLLLRLISEKALKQIIFHFQTLLLCMFMPTKEDKDLWTVNNSGDGVKTVYDFQNKLLLIEIYAFTSSLQLNVYFIELFYNSKRNGQREVLAAACFVVMFTPLHPLLVSLPPRSSCLFACFLLPLLSLHLFQRSPHSLWFTFVPARRPSYPLFITADLTAGSACSCWIFSEFVSHYTAQ